MLEKNPVSLEVAPKNTGLVYIFTGDGKGKTSAAMWTAVRAALAGKKVAIVHWYKESRWPTNDQKIKDLFPNLEDFLMGQGFYNLPSDHASVDEHSLAAKAALVKATELLTHRRVTGGIRYSGLNRETGRDPSRLERTRR